jgi:hypothetical protein
LTSFVLGDLVWASSSKSPRPAQLETFEWDSGKIFVFPKTEVGFVYEIFDSTRPDRVFGLASFVPLSDKQKQSDEDKDYASRKWIYRLRLPGKPNPVDDYYYQNPFFKDAPAGDVTARQLAVLSLEFIASAPGLGEQVIALALDQLKKDTGTRLQRLYLEVLRYSQADAPASTIVADWIKEAVRVENTVRAAVSGKGKPKQISYEDEFEGGVRINARVDAYNSLHEFYKTKGWVDLHSIELKPTANSDFAAPINDGERSFSWKGKRGKVPTGFPFMLLSSFSTVNKYNYEMPKSNKKNDKAPLIGEAIDSDEDDLMSFGDLRVSTAPQQQPPPAVAVKDALDELMASVRRSPRRNASISSGTPATGQHGKQATAPTPTQVIDPKKPAPSDEGWANWT